MLSIEVVEERLPYAKPFRISGREYSEERVIVVSLFEGSLCGRGEATGVDYRGETTGSMIAQVRSCCRELEVGIDQSRLYEILPPGGARNAIDCALWDLQSKISNTPCWRRASLPKPSAVLTTFTCGADAPLEMAQSALAFAEAKAIKIKLTGEPTDSQRVRAIRNARPDVWLSVDPNQGLDIDRYKRLLPTLVECNVSLIEQPFPIGKEGWLDDLPHVIPFAADESVQTTDDLDLCVGRFDFINIKLDKCGGLTEALKMVKEARKRGLGLMVGAMGGSSLAMAPAWLVAQLSDVVDLDTPALLRFDRSPGVSYRDGLIDCPSQIWGNPL